MISRSVFQKNLSLVKIVLQMSTLALAGVLIYDGFTGSPVAAKNLGSLLGWVHFRGLLILALLLFGNFFCMSCPMMASRNILRRFIKPRWHWPVPLRRKWLALGLLLIFLFCYEAFSLWESPTLTATIALVYFAAALLVDGLFQGSSFCKYICPIGQFNFIASQNSPLEVGVRSPQICASCTTHDCIRGRYEDQKLIQIGCERGLYLPKKVGNLDCTFCMDCVQACPHDNVRLVSRLPAVEIAADRRRAGIGRLTQRPDIACLAAVFSFGALMNAFGMVSPVYALEKWLNTVTGLGARWALIGIIQLLGLILLPTLLLLLTSRFSQARSVRAGMQAVALCLVPLGFGMWVAHYLFHFLTGFMTIVPVAQHVLLEHEISWFGAPRWGMLGIPARFVAPIEYGFLFLGLLGSMIVALQVHSTVRRAASTFVLLLLLFAVAAWLLNQPMEMRGMQFG